MLFERARHVSADMFKRLRRAPDLGHGLVGRRATCRNALVERLADLQLVLGKSRGRQRGEFLRDRERILQQFARLGHLVDQAALERAVGVVGRAAEA